MTMTMTIGKIWVCVSKAVTMAVTMAIVAAMANAEAVEQADISVSV